MQGAYRWQQDTIEAALQLLNTQHATGSWRVRLLLDAQGQVEAQAYALPATAARVHLQLPDRPLAEAHSEFVHF